MGMGASSVLWTISNNTALTDRAGEGVHTEMKTVTAFLFLAATLTGTAVAQTCLTLKPIELPPMGHPYASQQCVCQSMNRGCHWAWVDQPTTTAQDTNITHPYVNQADQVQREQRAARQREKELREQQQFAAEQQRESEARQHESEERQDALVKAQNSQTNDLDILKAVHDGVLAPVAPGDHTTSPTIRNSSGQEFRVVVPASDHATLPPPSTDSSQYFTQGLLNGRMWIAMSEPDRVFYVSAFLQGYAISCFYASDDAGQQKACYAKLGDTAHTNPVDPHEIVDGVDRIFAAPVNQGLIIPVAIKAASMKANGEPQDGIDKYLQTERGAVESPTK